MTSQEPCLRWATKIRTYGLLQVRVNGDAPELGSSEASCCVADPDIRVVHQRWVTPAFPKAGTAHGTTRWSPSHRVALKQCAPGTDVRLFEHLRLGESGD
jgi:hypothetical protein